MATFDYIEARAVAEELLIEFGESLPLITKGNQGTLDAFGNLTAATPDTEITGLCSPLLDYDMALSKGAYEENGTEIIAGDKYAYYHTDSTPEIGMQLTANGLVYRVQSIVWLSALDGTRVYTKLQLRS